MIPLDGGRALHGPTRQRSTAGGSMPRTKNTNTVARRIQHRPRKLTAKQSHEIPKQAMALNRLGLYNRADKKKITSKTKFTPRQERYILDKFNFLQSHGQFINGIGTVRPLHRTKRGYTLTPFFRTDKRKIVNPKIIKTKKGSIVPRSLGSIKLHKDKSISTTQKIMGKKLTVRSGELTPAQSIKFLNSVLDGTYKFPKNTLIRMHLYDSFPDEALSLKDLKRWASKYGNVVESSASKGYSALTLDYIKL